MSKDCRSWSPVFIVFLWSSFLSVAGARLWRFAAPMPGYWAEAQEFVRYGHIGGTFTPDFYPALLGTGVKWFGRLGVPVVQGIFYVLWVLAAFWLARILSLKPRTAAILAMVAALCPDLVTSIQKIWDLGPQCTAVFALAACIEFFLVESGLGLVALTGIVFGIGIALRPNFPVFVLPLALAIWLGLARQQYRLIGSALRLAGVLVIAAATLYCANTYAHGSFYLPENGPYNLFAGANNHTADALLRDENAEPSIGEYWVEHYGHIPIDAEVHSSALNSQYSAWSWQYITQHPFRWGIEYSTLKIFTAFRPDTKIHRLLSPIGLVRLVSGLGVFVWIGALIRAARSHSIDRRDWLLVVFAAVYVLPFLLTNSDPRFGFPLSTLLWIHAITLVLRNAIPPSAAHIVSEIVSGEVAN